MFILRYILVGGAAVVVTTMLFFVMHLLITHGLDDTPPEVPPLKNIDLVRLKPESAVEEEAIELPDKVIPQDAPQAPDLDLPTSDLGTTAALNINIEAPTMSSDVEISLGDGPIMGKAAADTDAVPMVRVNPMYPPEARQQRLEGWVRMEFSISKSGSVMNAKVLSSKPPGIFDEAALKAISKWKYKAKVVDGERVERHGIKVKLKFELENM